MCEAPTPGGRFPTSQRFERCGECEGAGEVVCDCCREASAVIDGDAGPQCPRCETERLMEV